MALTLPSRKIASKRSSARLDVLRLTLDEGATQRKIAAKTGDSPRDSLSPLEERFSDEREMRGRSRHAVDLTRLEDAPSGMRGRSASISTREAAAQWPRHGNEARDPPFHEANFPHASPRARKHRPKNLIVDISNGLTTASVAELKQRISDGRTANCDTKIQIPRRRPKRRLPKTPIREIAKTMGNTHSNASSPTPENASIRHHTTRNPVRVLHKSSANLLHRADTKTPLSPTNSSTVLEVRQQASPPVTEDEKCHKAETRLERFMDGARSCREHPLSPVGSTLTITENGIQSLSASTTSRRSGSDARTESRRGSRMGERLDSSEEVVLPSRPTSGATNYPLRISPAPPLSKRDSALSPTIPAPSPLPEDSPHKYGLKDRMDTPEAPEPEEISVVKPRRRSSGLEIFNEAKSLQSASSFLNGLSTSRRRAESLQRSTEASAWTLASYDAQRPGSVRLLRPPSRPSSALLPANGYVADRRRGHNFKPSGFAYTRPLTHVQVKCFKQHTRLLPSRNKVAPVECSVCHIDDDRDHYSCSWCAIRMCRYCRKDFAERGVTALRERIKSAEFGTGGGGSGSSSAESLGLARGQSSFL